MRRIGNLVAVALLVGCDKPPSSAALGWKVAPQWRIGMDGGGPSFSDLYPFQVDADQEHVYVLDQSTQRVFLLDADGRMVDTVGRSGAGPGEFVAPWAIARNGSGGFSVVDLGARRLVSWTRDRELASPILFHEQLDSPQLRFLNQKPTFLTVGMDEDGKAEFQLALVDSSSRSVLAHLPKPPRRVGDLPTCQARRISLTPFFAPTIHWDTRDSLLVVAASAGYVVDILRGDARIATLTRPLPSQKATEADALRAAENWKFNDCLVPPEEVIRAATYLEIIPVVENVVLSPDSLVWVQRRSGSPAHAIDVFTLSGTFIGTLDQSVPFPAAFIDANRYVAIERDSLDVPSVVGYRLTRN
jgi:hypothetical protein